MKLDKLSFLAESPGLRNKYLNLKNIFIDRCLKLINFVTYSFIISRRVKFALLVGNGASEIDLVVMRRLTIRWLLSFACHASLARQSQ